ncbi:MULTISPECIES: hypothetical protein [unclassified Streptomyces]|uniref:hypothetical protein n=1 Tax=unclassified Streptomyces TaxID=2593676 RepID=UPI0011E67A60|nr:hypothetical protein [Streptomyces sp. sk2.1]TXS67839.1 hypothetical protein EAO76_34330 [Streptomyces sp. sk2.1]
MSGAPEPAWLVVANVVLWRRYGDGGQELRPGTKAYRGGAKVYVVDTYAGMGHQQLTTVGRGRHNGHWITIDTGTRHLHTFRARLVYTPAVLKRCPWTVAATREEAEELAALLERVAREERHAHHGAPHPDPCLCHECLPVTPG